MKINKQTILSNIKVSERYWHMVVEALDTVNDIEPGQFFNVKCVEESYPFLR